VLNNKEYINKIFQSNKPLIIYKTVGGYDVYTDFKEKIVLNSKNLKNFLNKKTLQPKSSIKELNCYVGFFGFQLLCENIKIKLPKQQSLNFYPGLFYKPQTIIKIRKNIIIKSLLKNFKQLCSFKSNVNYFYQKKFNLNLNESQYSGLFRQFSKKIKLGETYQIKICQTYANKSNIDAVKFFWKLMSINESPESFLIRDKDYSIISCSPETLIQKKKDVVMTKPIAGTLNRTKKMTAKFANDFFKKNEKESKEHNMIVDMERNDLSRICKTGSVKINKLKNVEEYRDLYHYVTEIKGKLKKNIKNHDIVSAMMPGGSVIGCPKISTIKLLNSREKLNRNIYTGSFGYINANGDMRFNIIIRSILNYKKRAEISAASGVVIDSKPKREYKENHIKAKSLLDLFKT
jgi:anthranilate/para-aminobenzoate synthase component I